MVRKSAAYIFIILANLVLLTHVVVPHHHHDLEICFKDDCHCEGANTCCNALAHNHQGDHSDNTNCILVQLAVVPGHQGRNDCDCSVVSDNHTQGLDFFLLFNCEVPAIPVSEIHRNIPPNLPHYACQSISVTGLRAPPAV